MRKSAGAFRTISEVADWLGVETHVLRFWESKFHQIRPVKGAGGRRYYRPADMQLISGIKALLYDDGLSIKEAKSQLKSVGIKQVSARSAVLPEDLGKPAKPLGRAVPKPNTPEVEKPKVAVEQSKPQVQIQNPPAPREKTAAPSDLNFEGSLFASLFDAKDQTPVVEKAQPAIPKGALSQLAAIHRFSHADRVNFKQSLDLAARRFSQLQN